MEAKVGISYEGVTKLFIINKKKTLKENVQDFCDTNNLLNSDDFALKFNYTPISKNVKKYVTDDNFADIQNGDTFEMVESLDSLIDRIFVNFLSDRHRTFDVLYSMSVDSGFIKVLVRKQKHFDVIHWLTDKYLQGKELAACLLTLLQMLKEEYVDELLPDVVQNIIRCAKQPSVLTTSFEIQYALAVLCQILYLNGHESNKELIIRELSIQNLMPFIWKEEHLNLHLNTMMLINAMVKSVRGEKQLQLIKELNRKSNKTFIFTKIIQRGNVDTLMARELYLYQTYVLSLYSDGLHSSVTISHEMKQKEHDIDDISRSSTILEFEEGPTRSRSDSTNTVLDDAESVRLSFASMGSEKSGGSTFYDDSPMENNVISTLTYDSLAHYEHHYRKHSRQSFEEAKAYGPGIYEASEKITKLLVKLLQIGQKPHRSKYSYLPVVFNTETKLPFFYEIFSRTMWLLSKTRREMRAYAGSEFSKVLIVLERQLQMVFDLKPTTFKSVTEKMMDVSYSVVEEQWQEEKREEWKVMYETHPSVQSVKKNYVDDNRTLLFEKRIRVMQKGDAFPKLPEKKGKQLNFYLKLSDNRRTLFLDDSNVDNFKDSLQYNVNDIKHVVTGKACPHVRDHSCKHPEYAFSVAFENGKIINCVAKNSKTANLWIDGFNLLLEKSVRSSDYLKDLEELLEMDCALHLLDLQDIIIPDKPPLVPPLPKELRRKEKSKKQTRLHKSSLTLNIP